uniref:SRR1 domain containing n=1 Tax=Anser brachyrhynchus TaxID=132585 RepID=A0A8B9D1K5_9AVES
MGLGPGPLLGGGRRCRPRARPRVTAAPTAAARGPMAEGAWGAPGGRRRRRRGRAVTAEGGAVLRRLREARALSPPVSPPRVSSHHTGCSPHACPLPPQGSVPTGPPHVSVPHARPRPHPCPHPTQVPPDRCSVFDPAFSELEVAALGELGLRLLPENEEGKHRVREGPTLFYMVHCGKALYNNLLWRNWSPAALSDIVIIGNSFKGMEERLLSRILERDYSYIAKVLKGTEEVALPAHPRYTDTFNDTSVHWFPPHKLEQLSAEVWEFLEEPTYQECEDLEIIRKGDEGNGRSPTAAQS